MEIIEKQKLGLSGYLIARVAKKKGGPFVKIWVIPVPNLITDSGLAAAALALGSTAAFGWGAVGEGTTDPVVGDTALESEVDREATSFSRVTTTKTNDTMQHVSEHTAPAGGWDITEYALCDAASGGNIYNRVEFGAIALAEGNILQLTYKSPLSPTP